MSPSKMTFEFILLARVDWLSEYDCEPVCRWPIGARIEDEYVVFSRKIHAESVETAFKEAVKILERLNQSRLNWSIDYEVYAEQIDYMVDISELLDALDSA